MRIMPVQMHCDCHIAACTDRQPVIFYLFLTALSFSVVNLTCCTWKDFHQHHIKCPSCLLIAGGLLLIRLYYRLHSNMYTQSEYPKCMQTHWSRCSTKISMTSPCFWMQDVVELIGIEFCLHTPNPAGCHPRQQAAPPTAVWLLTSLHWDCVDVLQNSRVRQWPVFLDAGHFWL